MKQFVIVPLFFLLQSAMNLCAQAINPYRFFVKVKTDSGIITKNLWEVSDSSIWLTDARMANRLCIPVSSIYCIIVKKPLVSASLHGLAGGALFGGALFSLAYVDDWARHTDNFEPRYFTDPYLQSLGYSAILGASVGFVTGFIQAAFLKKKLLSIKASTCLREIKRN
jgi:hypothetical protein